MPLAGWPAIGDAEAMGFLHTLIVGVDGSEPSAAALRWAATRVAAGGTLHLVHTAPDSRAFDGSAAPMLDEGWVRPAEGCDASVVTHVLPGDTAEVLLAVADQHRGDAIVVGPHSAAYRRTTLGRVTRRLLRGSVVPVVIPEEQHPVEGGPPCGPVVACVGYGDATEAAAMWAADYAHARGLPLSLLHVVGYRPIFPADSPSDMLASYLGGDLLHQWAAEDLDEIRERVCEGRSDLVVTTTVDVGSASRAIVDAAVGAELVVLGKRRDNAALRTFISPRIHQLIVKAPSTVAVVPSCSPDR